MAGDAPHEMMTSGLASVTAGERTQDVFERLRGYPLPAKVIALPELAEPFLLDEAGYATDAATRLVLKRAWTLAGVARFSRSLAGRLDQVLRSADTRSHFFPPVLSASLALRDDPRIQDAIERAATLLLGARSLFEDLEVGRLRMDQLHGEPLEMGLYPNLFSTSVVVDAAGDRLWKSADRSRVAVLCRGHVHVLTLWDEGNSPTAAEVQAALRAIVNDPSSQQRVEMAVGVLTAGRDETQREVFAVLGRSPTNARSLSALRNCFATLCLDLDARPQDAVQLLRAAHVGDHDNRWYHASLQLVAFANGKAAVVCSFRAWLDGNTMMRGAAEIQRRACAVAIEGGDHTRGRPVLRSEKLVWQIDAKAIERARDDVASVTDDDPRASFVMQGVGSRVLRAAGVAPIPAFVAATALAARRLAGRMPEIAQFVSMSKYRCVGVRTAKVSTPELVAWTNAVLVRDPTARELLPAALSSQVERCRRVRSTLPLRDLLTLFERSLAPAGLRARFSRFVLYNTTRLLSRSGRYREPVRDVLVSHPEVFDEIPVSGRPGVRLPYVRFFAMHYQIAEDSITLAFARGFDWSVSNEQLVRAIESSLRDLLLCAAPAEARVAL